MPPMTTVARAHIEATRGFGLQWVNNYAHTLNRNNHHDGPGDYRKRRAIYER